MKLSVWAVRVFEFREGRKKLVLHVQAEGEDLLHQSHQVMLDWEGPLPEMGKLWELTTEDIVAENKLIEDLDKALQDPRIR